MKASIAAQCRTYGWKFCCTMMIRACHNSRWKDMLPLLKESIRILSTLPLTKPGLTIYHAELSSKV